jgi:hypothetical protein
VKNTGSEDNGPLLVAGSWLLVFVLESFGPGHSK